MELKFEHIRLANENELKFMQWEAIERRDKRLLDRIKQRYNELEKYDY